ncbi:hypothetical protein PM082_004477 [Marasmius tenuissimus]|nr:hypothetical protein PM082_004477 [Marasmius tenuissimus]
MSKPFIAAIDDFREFYESEEGLRCEWVGVLHINRCTPSPSGSVVQHVFRRSCDNGTVVQGRDRDNCHLGTVKTFGCLGLCRGRNKAQPIPDLIV